LPELTKLLNVTAALTQISRKEEKTVYYVKEEAEKAIRLIKSRNADNKAIDNDKK